MLESSRRRGRIPRPETGGRTGRAVSAAPFGLKSTMHRAGTRWSRATSRLYNHSSFLSSTAVNIAGFILGSFFAPYRAHVWRIERATTPPAFGTFDGLLAVPSPRDGGMQA